MHFKYAKMLAIVVHENMKLGDNTLNNERLSLRGGSRGRVQGVRKDDLRFSNTTGILQKKTMWFIGVEVEQETSAPPTEKNPRSAPLTCIHKICDKILANCSPYFTALQYINNLETKRSYKRKVNLKNLNFF